MDLGLKDEFLIHLVFASLPKEYETFVVNYNMQPDKWDIEKLIAMCVCKKRCRVHKPGVPHGPASQQKLDPADNVANDA